MISKNIKTGKKLDILSSHDQIYSFIFVVRWCPQWVTKYKIHVHTIHGCCQGYLNISGSCIKGNDLCMISLLLNLIDFHTGFSIAKA